MQILLSQINGRACNFSTLFVPKLLIQKLKPDDNDANVLLFNYRTCITNLGPENIFYRERNARFWND